jgi:hypothetical protein
MKRTPACPGRWSASHPTLLPRGWGKNRLLCPDPYPQPPRLQPLGQLFHLHLGQATLTAAAWARNPRRSVAVPSSPPHDPDGGAVLRFAPRRERPRSHEARHDIDELHRATIEEVLRQYPGVAAVGVSGAFNPTKGEMIVAFVVLAPGVTVKPEDHRAHCRSLAASYKTPDRIEICETLPVTTTGKLLRRELKQMAAALEK